MKFQHITIHKDASIIEALIKLNNLKSNITDISKLILFVYTENRQIIGSITDGDIRRSIVNHKNLDQTVDEVCNHQFLYEFENNHFIDLSQYHKKDIKILPLLNQNKQLVDIIDLEKVKAKLPLECMIMAGGRGKRLSPLTDSTPKPMLPLGDKPIIEHNIDRLIEFGIKKIYISVKYLGEKIEEYFGDGSSKGISIEYIWEDKPLGTAGALALVEQFNTEHILVMNSDLFTNINFEELYLKLIHEKADMAVASTEYKVDVPYAVFETENGVVKSFTEKPSYIYHSNAGIYILKKELINKIPKGQFFDITELMENIVNEGGKLVYDPILGYWIDIGKPVDYKQAQEFVKHLQK